MPETKKLNFPRIKKVKLRNFSLFDQSDEIDESFNEGVFCVVGANGLGKSTLLSSINFGLTGIVPEPNKPFKSIEEFYRYRLDFGKEYFEGRIGEKDREDAEIEIEFSLGKSTFRIVRGLFEPDTLREFEFTDLESNVKLEQDKVDGEEIQKHYREKIVSGIGLKSFEQFVFLQHFIFTFDESRHLVFWAPNVLEQCLYLVFGFDFEVANQADLLNREIQKHDSWVRNISSQAGNLRNTIEELKQSIGETADVENSEKLLKESQEIETQIEEQENKIEKLQMKMDDSTLLFSEANSKYSILRTEYNSEFDKQLKSHSLLSMHPIVVSSLNNHACQLCGAKGEKVVSAIKEITSGENCALCGSEVTGKVAEKKDFTKLKQIDEKINESRLKMDSALKATERLRHEINSASDELKSIEKRKLEFEKENKKFVFSLKRKSGEGSIQDLIEKYRVTLKDLTAKKAGHYQKREDKKKELKNIQKVFEKKYGEAESEFVPLFKDLAGAFLGLDLDISLKTKKSTPGMNLELEIKGTPRRQTYQLSESQRFFVDIALRMAFAQYISSPESKACLLIDTPEGSLDIAYESKAGEMLSKFVKNGHQLILTTNINSSNLILKLAGNCGRAQMSICRMTSWAELSEVQIAEEDLFDKAFKAIETALGPVKGTK